eukprot:11180652-Lingulodinium_polyedra.AAC.1
MGPLLRPVVPETCSEQDRARRDRILAAADSELRRRVRQTRDHGGENPVGRRGWHRIVGPIIWLAVLQHRRGGLIPWMTCAAVN